MFWKRHPLQLIITSVDYAPEDLHEQTPLKVNLRRKMPGDDRPDYWLGEVQTPIRWRSDVGERTITHIILAARWEGTRIARGARDLPVGIAYVVDQSLLDEPRLDFAKCSYVAIGIAHDGSSRRVFTRRRSRMLSGTIGRFFGTGNQERG